LSINGVNYSFRKHEVGDETARDGCQVRLENDILYSFKDTFCYKISFKSVINRKEPEPQLIFRLLGSLLRLHNNLFVQVDEKSSRGSRSLHG
jgi:hypothetical protein